jgi:GNAT superfamily N-acetyltransferase
MIAPVEVRPLRADDLAALDGVLTRAYGRSFARRLASYLEMQALGTFVAVLDGSPVGMVIGNDYGALAYVGQMAVDPPFQRRGIATALMNDLIAWADARGFAGIELDATPVGAPLYARYGFAAAGETRVYESPQRGGALGSGVLPLSGDPRAARPYAPDDWAALIAADARAIGGDRAEMLRLLIDDDQNIVVVSGPPGSVTGYALAQRLAQTLGPVVAPDAATAAGLIDAARDALACAHRLHIGSASPALEAILAARGYRLVRSLAHMVRGTRPAAARETIIARANLGQG